MHSIPNHMSVKHEVIFQALILVQKFNNYMVKKLIHEVIHYIILKMCFWPFCII